MLQLRQPSLGCSSEGYKVQDVCSCVCHLLTPRVSFSQIGCFCDCVYQTCAAPAEPVSCCVYQTYAARAEPVHITLLGVQVSSFTHHITGCASLLEVGTTGWWKTSLLLSLQLLVVKPLLEVHLTWIIIVLMPPWSAGFCAVKRPFVRSSFVMICYINLCLTLQLNCYRSRCTGDVFYLWDERVQNDRLFYLLV